MQTAGAQADKLSHQIQLNDQKNRVKCDYRDQRADYIARGQGRCGQVGGQNPADGPGLASVFRNEPAQFDGDPGNRQAVEQSF